MCVPTSEAAASQIPDARKASGTPSRVAYSAGSDVVFHSGQIGKDVHEQYAHRRRCAGLERPRTSSMVAPLCKRSPFVTCSVFSRHYKPMRHTPLHANASQHPQTPSTCHLRLRLDSECSAHSLACASRSYRARYSSALRCKEASPSQRPGPALRGVPREVRLMSLNDNPIYLSSCKRAHVLAAKAAQAWAALRARGPREVRVRSASPGRS